MTEELRAACRRAVQVVLPRGRVLPAGCASLYVLARLGWGPLAHLLALPPLLWVVEAAYRVVAANRGFFGRFLFRSVAPLPRAP